MNGQQKRPQRRKVPQVDELDLAVLLLDVAAKPAKAAKLLAERPEVLALAQAMLVDQDLGFIARTAEGGQTDWDVAVWQIWPDNYPGNRPGGTDART